MGLNHITANWSYRNRSWTYLWSYRQDWEGNKCGMTKATVLLNLRPMITIFLLIFFTSGNFSGQLTLAKLSFKTNWQRRYNQLSNAVKTLWAFWFAGKYTVAPFALLTTASQFKTTGLQKLWNIKLWKNKLWGQWSRRIIVENYLLTR